VNYTEKEDKEAEAEEEPPKKEVKRKTKEA